MMNSRQSIKKGPSVHSYGKRKRLYRAQLVVRLDQMEHELMDLDRAYVAILNRELEKLLHRAEGGKQDAAT